MELRTRSRQRSRRGPNRKALMRNSPIMSQDVKCYSLAATMVGKILLCQIAVSTLNKIEHAFCYSLRRDLGVVRVRSRSVLPYHSERSHSGAVPALRPSRHLKPRRDHNLIGILFFRSLAPCLSKSRNPHDRNSITIHGTLTPRSAHGLYLTSFHCTQTWPFQKPGHR